MSYQGHHTRRVSVPPYVSLDNLTPIHGLGGEVIFFRQLRIPIFNQRTILHYTAAHRCSE